MTEFCELGMPCRGDMSMGIIDQVAFPPSVTCVDHMLTKLDRQWKSMGQ